MSTAKKAAAEAAVEEIKSGMLVGLGTGTTAQFAIEAVGKKVKEGLAIKAVASSVASEEEARKAGIEVVSFDGITALDIYIDGADEVDAERNLIKGGGGALLREKILAYNSKRFVVIVDESKLVKNLGKFGLPVEVVPFAQPLTTTNISRLGGKPTLRTKAGKAFITDNGNYILDCDFGSIDNPVLLNEQLHAIPGVVETGLFASAMVSKVIAGSNDGKTKAV